MIARHPMARRFSAPGRLLGGSCLLLATATAPISSWPSLILAGGVAAGLLALGRPRVVICAIALGSAFAVGLALTWPLWLAGGTARAAGLLARSLAATGVALGVGSMFEDHELAATLRWLRLPSALVDVVEMLLMELRLLGPLAERMALARRLRGARGFRAGGEMLAGLFVLSAERAERLALSRQLRGYDERAVRSTMRLEWRDVPALGAAIALAAVVHVAPKLFAHSSG